MNIKLIYDITVYILNEVKNAFYPISPVCRVNFENGFQAAVSHQQNSGNIFLIKKKTTHDECDTFRY